MSAIAGIYRRFFNEKGPIRALRAVSGAAGAAAPARAAGAAHGQPAAGGVEVRGMERRAAAVGV